MRAPNKRRRAWLALGLLLGCRDEPGFLPLDRLCSELAEDVCDARDGCCAPEDRDACEMREIAACSALQRAFVAEALTYDAEQADTRRASARAALDTQCTRSPLASFFDGGLALGATCARDAQCASGRCAADSATCSDPIAAPACAVP